MQGARESAAAATADESTGKTFAPMVLEPDVSQKVRTLYRVMDSIESKLGGGEGVEGLYGSIKGSDMQRILQCMAAFCGLRASSLLVDVGAGLGRPLLHALLGLGCPAAWGIEVDPVKCQKAEAFMGQVQRELTRRGGFRAFQLPRFDCGAIARVGSLDPLTHAYSFWEGIPVDARADFGRLFSASRSMQSVTVVQRSMRCADPAAAMDEWYGFGPLELCTAFPVSMSGSGQTFQAYVFKRTPGAAAAEPRRVAVAAKAGAASPLRRQRAAKPVAERKRERSPADSDAASGVSGNFFAGPASAAAGPEAPAASRAAAEAEQAAAWVRPRSKRIAGGNAGASVSGGEEAGGDVSSSIIFKWPLLPREWPALEVGTFAGAQGQLLGTASDAGVRLPSRRAGRRVNVAAAGKALLPSRGLGVVGRRRGRLAWCGGDETMEGATAIPHS